VIRESGQHLSDRLHSPSLRSDPLEQYRENTVIAVATCLSYAGNHANRASKPRRTRYVRFLAWLQATPDSRSGTQKLTLHL